MLVTSQLGGIKRGDPGLSFTPKPKDESDGSESDEHSIPKKMQKGYAFDSHRIYGGGHDESFGDFKYVHEPVAPCIYPGTSLMNHQNSQGPPQKSHRRKGIPRRAPF